MRRALRFELSVLLAVILAPLITLGVSGVTRRVDLRSRFRFGPLQAECESYDIHP